MKENEAKYATRSTLMGRLKDLGDQQAWQEFFDIYWTLMFNFVRRAGLNEHDAEEVVMDSMETVARKMEEFEYNRETGRFKSWLLTIVRFKLGDRFRKQKRRAEKAEMVSLDGVDEGQVLDSGEIELERIWDKEWRKQLIDMALERVKQLVGHRQYQIFYCYVIQEQKAEEVAEFLGVSRDQVYVAKNRVGKVYEGELKILGKEML